VRSAPPAQRVVKYFTGFPFSPSVLQNGRRCPKGGGGHAVKASAYTMRNIKIPSQNTN